MRVLAVRNTRVWSLLYFAGSTVFVVVGAFAGVRSGSWESWAGVVFFGACAAFFLRELFRTEPQVIINETGVWDAKTGFPMIEWADIKTIYTEPSFSRIIYIEVFDEEKYYENFSDAGRKLHKIDTFAMPSRFRVDLSGTAADRGKIYDLLRENLDLYRKKNYNR